MYSADTCQNAPTGFEEFFTDPPLTPDEHAENKITYDPSIPFVERILTAIQKFERTRKLLPIRRDIYYKYLSYGGVDVSQNMFQGIDPKSEAFQDMTKEAIAAAMARTSIASDKNSSLYEVDFYGCAAAFLSRRAGDQFPFDTIDQVEQVCSTLERFFDYLLQRDVCPEHAAEVLRTRNLCRTAPAKLWHVTESTRKLPGDFNAALSTLFEGQYARNYDGVTDWSTVGTDELGQSYNAHSFIGFTSQEAQQIVRFGIAGAAEEQVYLDFERRVQDHTLAVEEKMRDIGFEITQIVPPNEQCKELYKTQSKNFRPVGRVYAKPWTAPGQPPEDLSPAELQAQLHNTSSTPPVPSTIEQREYCFLIEEPLQENLHVGMKVECTIHLMNCGDTGKSSTQLAFFDEVLRCFPDFDTYLEGNELMLGWKEPRPVEGAVGGPRRRDGRWVVFGEAEGEEDPEGEGEEAQGVEGGGKVVDGQDGGGGEKPAGVV